MLKINPSDQELLEERWGNVSKEIIGAFGASPSGDDLDDFATGWMFIKMMQELDLAFTACQPFITPETIEHYKNRFYDAFDHQFHAKIRGEIVYLLSIKYYLKSNFTSSTNKQSATKLSEAWVDDSFEECIKVLKSKQGNIKPILDTNGTYIGDQKNDKGILAAWFVTMEGLPKIHRGLYSQEKKRDLVLAQFPTLKSLGIRTLDASGVNNNYFKTFEALFK